MVSDLITFCKKVCSGFNCPTVSNREVPFDAPYYLHGTYFVVVVTEEGDTRCKPI
jgi:hypothetical protein